MASTDDDELEEELQLAIEFERKLSFPITLARLYLASPILCYVVKASVASSVLQLCQPEGMRMRRKGKPCSCSSVWLGSTGEATLALTRLPTIVDAKYRCRTGVAEPWLTSFLRLYGGPLAA